MSGIQPARQLTLEEAQNLTRRIKQSVEATWEMILVAHAGHAWVPLGYSGWAEYVRTEFAMSRSYSYRLIDKGHVILALSEAAGVSSRATLYDPQEIITERQARRIKPQLANVVEAVKDGIAGGMDPLEALNEAVDYYGTPTPNQANEIAGVTELEVMATDGAWHPDRAEKERIRIADFDNYPEIQAHYHRTHTVKSAMADIPNLPAPAEVLGELGQTDSLAIDQNIDATIAWLTDLRKELREET